MGWAGSGLLKVERALGHFYSLRPCKSRVAKMGYIFSLNTKQFKMQKCDAV